MTSYSLKQRKQSIQRLPIPVLNTSVQQNRREWWSIGATMPRSNYKKEYFPVFNKNYFGGNVKRF